MSAAAFLTIADVCGSRGRNNPNVHQLVNRSKMVVYSYNEFMLNNGKMQIINTCNNMDVSQKHCAK